MPSAQGLLHRAAVQSGSTLTLATREAGTRNASRLLARLGLSTRRLTELRDVPVEMLVAAQAGLEASTPPAQFAPVVDGVTIPRDPFSPTAPEVSRNVPMIISATRDEATAFAADPDLTDAGLLIAARALAGEANATRVITEYRDAYPEASPALLLARMTTDSGFLAAARTQADRKAEQGGAPAYMYLFTWPSPAGPPRWGATHGVDVALAFHNANAPITGDNAPRALALADDLAGAWVRFATTGDPNGGTLPHWPTYGPARETLMLGNTTTTEADPLRRFRLLWEELAG